MLIFIIRINVHNNIAYSRRDDLESLFYVMLYLYLGKLPWQGLNISNKLSYKIAFNKVMSGNNDSSYLKIKFDNCYWWRWFYA